jgi:starch phosphorylase
MSQDGKRISINIRARKKRVDGIHHHRARAHLHSHAHDSINDDTKEPFVATPNTTFSEPMARSTTRSGWPIKNSAPKFKLRSSTLSDILAGKEQVADVPAPPSVGIHTEPIVPVRSKVPRKPLVVEGMQMSSLQIAYFCMEIGIENAMPTYAGGLGILAGDMLRSAADLDLPMVGVTLIHHRGYFRQEIDRSGWQIEHDELWDPNARLTPLPHEVRLTLEGREVIVRAWLYKLVGERGAINPIIFLDTDVEGNTPEDRAITDRVYGGDQRYRLLQEAVLGIGGVRMLQKLGATNLQKFHMNEGHSALLTIELYRQYASCDDPLDEVRRRAVFTTHTPVAAGHDVFPKDLVDRVLGPDYIPGNVCGDVCFENTLNMTRLGFQWSGYINGVAKKHGEVTRDLFPGYIIEAITNGVSAREWVSPHFAKLYDKYLPGWRIDPYSLRYALSIPLEELWRTHQEAKQDLLEKVNAKYGSSLNSEVFTIGFARRATAYKRGNMLFDDVERLLRIAERAGKGLQIIYAGKAHPSDNEGKLLIQRIIENMRKVGHKISCVYLENYDMDLANRLVSGVDLWLNTPTRPQEASGTSGMKAALNGVPHFSVLDGWWLEGHIEGVTGWSIGPHPEKGVTGDPHHEDVEDLYTKLEYVILPRFESERDQWIKMMRQSIAINGSFFNSHRMVQQYVLGAYFK